MFLLAVGVVTTMALPVVGALLVFSLMIGPPATARFVTDRPAGAMAFSAGLGLVTVWVSIVASFGSNWPIGFFVAGFAFIWYVAGRLVAGSRLRSARRPQEYERYGAKGSRVSLTKAPSTHDGRT